MDSHQRKLANEIARHLDDWAETDDEATAELIRRKTLDLRQDVATGTAYAQIRRRGLKTTVTIKRRRT